MSELARKFKKPLAVSAAALAGLAFNGCGGGDKKIDFGVLCQKGSQLRVLGTTQPEYPFDSSKIKVACEDNQGVSEAPKSIQLAKLAGDNAVSANFKLSVKVDQEGDATWNKDTMASYDIIPGDNQAEITLENVDSLDEVKVSSIPVPKQ